MATGIVSVAVGAAGAATLAAVLLGLAIGCCLALVAAHGWRLSWWRPEFTADATDPAKVFAFFTLWSLVFPLGMYCVASRALGMALNVRWLVTAAHDGTWIAFGVWALVFTAMLTSLARSYRRLTNRSAT
jgi:hypothetical protein